MLLARCCDLPVGIPELDDHCRYQLPIQQKHCHHLTKALTSILVISSFSINVCTKLSPDIIGVLVNPNKTTGFTIPIKEIENPEPSSVASLSISVSS
jgi:hypothetical protein